jgi:hypothetical protein
MLVSFALNRAGAQPSDHSSDLALDTAEIAVRQQIFLKNTLFFISLTTIHPNINKVSWS